MACDLCGTPNVSSICKQCRFIKDREDDSIDDYGPEEGDDED